MSVWVEIAHILEIQLHVVSRSTWACELKSCYGRRHLVRIWSRSTWACELKLLYLNDYFGTNYVTLHVSVWVEIFEAYKTWEEETVTLHVSVWVEMAWAEILNVIQIVTLHVSVWVEIRSLRRGQDLWWKSRSTWACELKSLDLSKIPINHSVTLHVSVWVEMEPFGKFSCIGLGHAPRERVSWNDFLKGVVTDSGCHAPRERVSWNYRM